MARRRILRGFLGGARKVSKPKLRPGYHKDMDPRQFVSGSSKDVAAQKKRAAALGATSIKGQKDLVKKQRAMRAPTVTSRDPQIAEGRRLTSQEVGGIDRSLGLRTKVSDPNNPGFSGSLGRVRKSSASVEPDYGNVRYEFTNRAGKVIHANPSAAATQYKIRGHRFKTGREAEAAERKLKQKRGKKAKSAAQRKSEERARRKKAEGRAPKDKLSQVMSPEFGEAGALLTKKTRQGQINLRDFYEGSVAGVGGIKVPKGYFLTKTMELGTGVTRTYKMPGRIGRPTDRVSKIDATDIGFEDVYRGKPDAVYHDGRMVYRVPRSYKPGKGSKAFDSALRKQAGRRPEDMAHKGLYPEDKVAPGTSKRSYNRATKFEMLVKSKPKGTPVKVPKDLEGLLHGLKPQALGQNRKALNRIIKSERRAGRGTKAVREILRNKGSKFVRATGTARPGDTMYKPYSAATRTAHRKAVDRGGFQRYVQREKLMMTTTFAERRRAMLRKRLGMNKPKGY